MKVDLHTHTTASDGELTPAEIISAAAAAGVDVLAITDHDTIDGYLDVAESNSEIELIPGIEFSTNWHTTGIHLVGLNIDPDNPELLAGIRQQKQVRIERGQKIAQRLEKAGFSNTLEGALELADKSILGRPHFAHYLVESGQIKDVKTAFSKYLGRGKIGDVRDNWAPFQDVIGWVTAAGGVAVLAHPAKYKLTNMKLEALVTDFAAQGGHGIEVISGRQTPDIGSRLSRLATRHGLLASAGSDFHQPGQHWAGLGQINALPANCKAVWETW